ncbi:MAG: TrbI/VirB10 family protein [Phenylobacterium sp.]|uniref:TrbI/VirB10 family protein n=1 Tax=Phenylobacterium sp. TaxID=1871053 RepID=UPI001A643937|nr:TrbI/VirB10 family protein [Phenylobacterium sp.]MBL8770543.1 TrbI/VirB10 family protein [Phenylobacterium sp.]
MTVAGPSDAAGPTPKTPMPPLETRAPRPPVVRLRKGVVAGAVMAASGLVAGSLAWAFIVQPELRARAHEARLEGRPSEVRGAVRPSDRVTDAPATYADLDRLPEPRRLGGQPERARSQPTVANRAAAPQRRPAADGLTEEARGSALFFGGEGVRGAAPAGPNGGGGGPRGDYGAVYNTHELLPPLSPYEVKAGAVVPAALLTGVDTSRAGPVTASVTESVFDTVSGRHLLIPQGARLVGRHEGESRHGDARVFIVWDRLILPNGKSLVLPKEPGVDAQGAIGAKGEVDRRLFPLAVATLFAGAITTLGQAARDQDDRSGGLLGDAGDAASIEAAQVGGKLLDRELQVRPVVRLRPGARVRVFITRDLILEPYRP